jgi:chemotaxis protein methyltransferase CheR
MPELRDMDPATLDRALDLVRAHTGIALHADKQGMLQTRLRSRMRALGIGCYGDYLQRVQDDRAELPAFVDVVTTHQTAFFRTPALWDFIAGQALPQWWAAHPGERLRIWSAAASTGEEACTIAMCCEEFRRSAAPGLRWEVQCSDISAGALAQLRSARYAGVSAARLRAERPTLFDRYNASPETDAGDAAGATFTLAPALRAHLRLGTHNLLDACPWPGQFDLVFLRNVLIYFEGAAHRRIVEQALAALRPGGLLAVGEAESLRMLDLPLEFVRPQVYRRA